MGSHVVGIGGTVDKKRLGKEGATVVRKNTRISYSFLYGNQSIRWPHQIKILLSVVRKLTFIDTADIAKV